MSISFEIRMLSATVGMQQGRYHLAQLAQVCTPAYIMVIVCDWTESGVYFS